MSSIDCSTTLVGRSDLGTEQLVRPNRYRRVGPGPKLPDWLIRLNYGIGHAFGRFVFFCTMNAQVVRRETVDRPGGYVLACTHLSHVDPACVSVIANRKIDWMSRLEFYQSRLTAALMWAVGAFPVDRFGIPVSSIRTAIRRARQGRIVGIFPEGRVSHGADSVCRGGPIKKGACVVALRSGVPIIPCVTLGTHKLNTVGPWLPFRRAHIWMIFGRPILPPQGLPRRAAREALAAELQRETMSIYNELRQRYGIDDRDIP